MNADSDKQTEKKVGVAANTNQSEIEAEL